MLHNKNVIIYGLFKTLQEHPKEHDLRQKRKLLLMRQFESFSYRFGMFFVPLYPLFPQAWSVRTAGLVQSSSEGPQFVWSGCTRASKRAWYWTEMISVTHAEIWTSLCAISSCLLWTVFMILWSGPVLKDLSFLSPIAHYCKSIRKKVVAHAAIWTSLIRTIQQFLSKKSNLIQKQGRACRAVTGFHTPVTVADIKAIWLMSLRFEHKWPLENQCPWRTLGKPIP